MKLTAEEGRMIIWGDHEDWVTVVEEKCIDQSRWSLIYEGVFKHLPSNKYYSLVWSVGATEQQDERPFEYVNPEPVEVRAVEKTVTVWEAV